MQPNPFLGVFLHAVGGLAAGSFYIPFKRVRKWAWESYWLVGGVASWLLMPWIVAFIKVPHPLQLLSEAPAGSLFWSFTFGVLWGFGGLTFGLTMRYLGMSLGYAMALGFCAAFGTVIPPIFHGQFGGVITSVSGQVVIMGVLICLGGIAVCGMAGVSKERELTDEEKKATISEFSFVKGLWIAVFCGVMSACMSFGIDAGKPIAALAVKYKVDPLWQNTPVFIVIFAGGLLTNLIWCVFLNIRNKTGSDYIDGSKAPLAINYIFAAMAGIIWYFQFMFYGMGTTQMGKYDFSSWALHMAFIIVFSNIWGLIFREWRGTSNRTRGLILAGIGVLIASTMIIGYGNSKAGEKAQPTAATERN